LQKFILRLFKDLDMAISMGSNLMAFAINHPHHFRSPLCHISKDEEGGLHLKTAKQGEDLLHIEKDPVLASIPGRTRKDMLNITDMIPILHIHR
jgi:hypothetical protein